LDEPRRVDGVTLEEGVGVIFEAEGTCTEHFQILSVAEFKLIFRSTDLKQHQNSAGPVGKDGRQGLRYGLIIIIRDLGLAMDAVVEKGSIFECNFIFECNSLLCNFISECNLQTYMHTLVHFGSAWLVKLDLSYGVCCSESLFCTFYLLSLLHILLIFAV